jgi:hypothetical protein
MYLTLYTSLYPTKGAITMATATKEAKQDTVDVHHMLRTISFTNQETVDGALPVDAVDSHVRNWLDSGYKLFAAHYAGETPNGLRILYIFTRE